MSEIKACVFDAYGTLFDVHSAVARHRGSLDDKADAVSELWRFKQLQYTWLRSLMDRHCDFWQLTREALQFALDTHGVNDSSLEEALMQAYLSLDAYPEVDSVLSQLRDRGFRLAILSNGSPEMLAAAAQSAGISGLLDCNLSVETVGIYKPHPTVYQLAVDRLGIDAPAISFQSSNSWDAAGAATFGFQVAWVNRFKQKAERLPDQPEHEIDNLNQLLDLV